MDQEYSDNQTIVSISFLKRIVKEGKIVSQKVIDLIISVDDTREFHKKNLRMNRDHYSWMAKIMPLHITDMVNRGSTRIYFNPLVKFKGCTENLQYKYGIIHYTDFIDDLVDWREFYTAARLQKPVIPIILNVSGYK